MYEEKENTIMRLKQPYGANDVEANSDVGSITRCDVSRFERFRIWKKLKFVVAIASASATRNYYLSVSSIL